MRLRLTILATVCIAAGTGPAAAQFFDPPPSQRTIVLSPGWHLSGPPVRSADGLRFAVRNDAGVLRDMTVQPNGAITFSPEGRKPKAAPSPDRRKMRAAVRPPAERTVNKPDDGPKKVTAKLDGEGNPAPAAAATKPAPLEPAPYRPAPAPVAAPTGPGYAHGVPINPLD